MLRYRMLPKSECIRPGVPLSLADAERLVTQYIQVYNEQRLHSAIGYITPKDMLAGRRDEIHQQRKPTIAAAHQRRHLAKSNTQRVDSDGVKFSALPPIPTLSGETEASSAGTQLCQGIA